LLCCSFYLQHDSVSIVKANSNYTSCREDTCTSASLVINTNSDSNQLEISWDFNVSQVDREVVSGLTGPRPSSLGPSTPSTSIWAAMHGQRVWIFQPCIKTRNSHSFPSIGRSRATFRAEMHEVDQLLFCRRWLKATTLPIAYSVGIYPLSK
jgi:hypothetical protein